MHITFKNIKINSKEELVQGILNGISGNGRCGTTAGAVLDVLYGRLRPLKNYLTVLYPNDPIAEKISCGSERKLVKDVIVLAKSRIVLKLKPLPIVAESIK